MQSNPYDAYTLGMIHSAMHEQCAEAKAAGYRWAQFMDVPTGYEAVKAGTVDSVVADGYLIVYAIGASWMAPPTAVFFEELLTLRIAAQPGELACVTRAYETLARENGAQYIVTGASTRRSFGRFLQSQGYEESANVYFKELT